MVRNQGNRVFERLVLRKTRGLVEQTLVFECCDFAFCEDFPFELVELPAASQIKEAKREKKHVLVVFSQETRDSAEELSNKRRLPLFFVL